MGSTDLTMQLSALLAVLPLLLSQVHGLDTCPDGWMEAHGVDMGCLFFSHPKDHRSHDDAKAYCVEKHEEAFLHLALQIMEEGSGVHETTWWNGATNGGVDGGPWYWEGTGETLIEDGMWGTWQPGEPQDGEGSCAVMESRKGFTWRATPCAMLASFICQIDGPLTPTESPLL